MAPTLTEVTWIAVCGRHSSRTWWMITRGLPPPPLVSWRSAGCDSSVSQKPPKSYPLNGYNVKPPNISQIISTYNSTLMCKHCHVHAHLQGKPSVASTTQMQNFCDTCPSLHCTTMMVAIVACISSLHLCIFSPWECGPLKTCRCGLFFVSSVGHSTLHKRVKVMLESFEGYLTDVGSANRILWTWVCIARMAILHLSKSWVVEFPCRLAWNMAAFPPVREIVCWKLDPFEKSLVIYFPMIDHQIKWNSSTTSTQP